MKMTLTNSQVVDALLRDANAKWSLEAALALADHYEDLERETGEEMELDVVAIRCDWTEYGSALEVAEAYGIQARDGETLEDTVEAYVRGRSDLIKLPKGYGYIVRAF